MPQLDPTWFLSQAFWLCLCFCLLYFVVSKFLAPRLADIAQRRQAKIDDYISQAQELNDDAQKIIKEYESSLSLAKGRANNQILKQKKELEDLIETKQNEANQKILKELKKTEDNIKKIKEEASKEAQKTAKALSKDIIKKLDL